MIAVYLAMLETDVDRDKFMKSHVYTQEQKNLLVWTDSKANITFRIIGMMDKDEMIKMAESVVVK